MPECEDLLMHAIWRRFSAAVYPAALVLVMLAACASQPTSSPAPAGGASPRDLRAMLPASIARSGHLIVATDASYAPMEYVKWDGTTVEGMDVDLAKLIANKLGLTVDVVNVPFDSIIPGLVAGRYDIGMSAFTDTKAREQAVDFVTYFSAGTFQVVKVRNPNHLAPGDTSLCGRTVAVEKGTVQEDPDLPDRSKVCRSNGKPPVISLVCDDQIGAFQALSSGQADAVLVDSPVAEYAVSNSNKFELAGASYDNAPYGIAVPKTSGQLKDALLQAVKELMADGSYQAVLKWWGLVAGGITDPTIDGAVG
jgi:polar amino acid transport system substrate-binding protein